MNKNMLGILYIVLAAAAFGVMPILAKLAYIGGSNTYSVLFLRFLFASLMLLYYLFKKRISLKLQKKQFWAVIFIAVCGFAASSVCLFSAYKYISVGLASMLLYTYPAIVTLLCILLYKEKMYMRKLISLLVSSLGIYILIGVKSEAINPIGILFALLAAVFYSLYIVGASHSEVKKINSYVLTFYVSFSACIVMFLLGLETGTLDLKLSFYSLVCVILLAFISTVVALMAFLQGVRLIGPSKAAIFSTLEPIVSLLLGFFILGEKLSLQVSMGSILILLSVVILAREGRTSQEKSRK